MPELYKLQWDNVGEHLYETGVNHAVLFPYNKTTSSYGAGVAWNGITGVTESPSGAEATPLYADNIKYLNLRSTEEFGATVTAYTYPDEFAVLDGSAEIATGVKIGQQKRRMFGLCYRTEMGTDEAAAGTGSNYKLHLVYNCLASPSERSYETINDSPEAITFSWEFSTTPVNVADVAGESFKPTACVTIDMWKLTEGKRTALESALYGTAATTGETPTAAVPGKLLLPDEIVTLLNSINN